MGRARNYYLLRRKKRLLSGEVTLTPRIQLSGLTASSGAGVGDLVGNLSVSDGSGVYTYSLTDGDALFDIDGSRLEVGAALSVGTESITIEADNGVDTPLSRTFSIVVSAPGPVSMDLASTEGSDTAAFTSSESLYALDLYFADMASHTEVADAGVTFSRGSHATMYDSTGKLTFAPNNMLLYSNDFTNAAWTKGSATVPAGGILPSGGTSVKLAASTTNTSPTVTQANPRLTGSYYLSSFVAKKGEANFALISFADNPGSGGAWFNLDTGSVGTTQGNAINAGMTSLGGGWYRCYVRTLAIADSSAGLKIWATQADNDTSWSGTVGDGIYIGEIQDERVTYETSPRTYNATTSAAYYGPRLDYDPATLAAKGLLVEEARTNLFTYSGTFSNAAWTKNSVTISQNATGPDGVANSAATMTLSAATNVFDVDQLQAPQGVTSTISVSAKAGTSRYLSLAIANGPSDGAWATFDLQTGTITQSAALTTGTLVGASIADIGGGFYRISLSGSFTTASTGYGLISASNSGTPANGSYGRQQFTSAGTETYIIYGAQLEAGSFATSYIPTTSASVTRPADAASMTGSNFSSWYNQSEGTFNADWYAGAIPASGQFYTVSADNGAYNDSHLIRFSSTISCDTFDEAVSQSSLTGASIVVGALNKTAYAYKVNDFALSSDGGTVQTDVSGTLPTPDRLTLGAFSGGGMLYLNGHIARLRYANTRLPDATLQSETAAVGNDILWGASNSIEWGSGNSIQWGA